MSYNLTTNACSRLTLSDMEDEIFREPSHAPGSVYQKSTPIQGRAGPVSDHLVRWRTLHSGHAGYPAKLACGRRDGDEEYCGLGREDDLQHCTGAKVRVTVSVSRHQSKRVQVDCCPGSPSPWHSCRKKSVIRPPSTRLTIHLPQRKERPTRPLRNLRAPSSQSHQFSLSEPGPVENRIGIPSRA